MEDRLKRLVESANPENRYQWARQWQSAGKKVVGILGSYVPEEVIHAAGLLPVRVIGTWEGAVELVRVHRPVATCQYGTHVLESVLRGEFDFLDGVVGTDRDQDLVRTWDVWFSLGKPSFSYCLHVPKSDTDLACRKLTADTREMVGVLERTLDVRVDDSAIERSIRVYEETARLLVTAYELRKRPVPPLSGAEYLGIVLASSLMPKEQFNAELAELLPFIERRAVSLAANKPRVLLSGDFLDNPAYVALVESGGCTVVMDDVDAGSRYFWPAPSDGASTDPVSVIARRYLRRPAGPHIGRWDRQAQHIIDWAKEYRADGVIQFLVECDRTAEMRSPIIRNKLTEAGIANAVIGRDYPPQNFGPLRTRLEAFVEMLEAR